MEDIFLRNIQLNWDIMLCSPFEAIRRFAGIAEFSTCSMLISFLAYTSNLKMEGICSSETSVVF
jgi:hypothetical protein